MSERERENSKTLFYKDCSLERGGRQRETGGGGGGGGQREREGERDNSKTLFYNDCSRGRERTRKLYFTRIVV